MKQANEIVGQVPEILENILSHCNAKSLSRAATVSRSWNEVSTRELQKRGPQIIIMPVSNVHDVIETKPQVTLFFINNSSWRISDLTKCQNYFPNHSVIVPTKTVMVDEKEIVYNDFQSKCGIVCLLIPQYRDVEIRTTYEKNLCANIKIGYDRDTSHADALIQPSLDKILPKDSKSKATFIIFGPALYHSSRYLELLHERMQERQQEYVIWGADVYTGPLTRMEVNELPDHQGLFAMSITGSSLESSSLMIGGNKTKHETDRKLFEFRDRVRLKRRSIGLLHGPDRGARNSSSSDWVYYPPNEYYWREELTETIRRIFPDVALIGVYDDYRCYGLMSKADDPHRQLKHAATFSLMILTFD